MRGGDRNTAALFSYVSCEARVAKDHPLRAIREIVNAALAALSPEFEKLYARLAMAITGSWRQYCLDVLSSLPGWSSLCSAPCWPNACWPRICGSMNFTRTKSRRLFTVSYHERSRETLTDEAIAAIANVCGGRAPSSGHD